MNKTICSYCRTEVPVIANVSSTVIVYCCSICGKQLINELYGGNTSFQNADDNNDKYLRCDICYRGFTQASGLKRHLAVHTGERPFICRTCNKSFKTKAAVKRHEVIHTGECPYECSVCKRQFNQISNLRKHTLIHDNKCPFYCPSCNKGFNQLTNLKKHLKVHQQRPEFMSKRMSKLSRSEHDIKRPVVTYVRSADECSN